MNEKLVESRCSFPEVVHHFGLLGIYVFSEEFDHMHYRAFRTCCSGFM